MSTTASAGSPLTKTAGVPGVKVVDDLEGVVEAIVGVSGINAWTAPASASPMALVVETTNIPELRSKWATSPNRRTSSDTQPPRRSP